MDVCSVYVQKDCSHASKLGQLLYISLLTIIILSPEFSINYNSAECHSVMINRITLCNDKPSK